jgi:AcrR family transcriptional regulator
MGTRAVSSPPSGERALGKRRAIVEAAQARFLAEGYDTSVDSIAADANVSKATVYNHFGSKEALFIAVISDALDAALGEAVNEARRQPAKTDDPMEALSATAHALVRGITQPSVLALRNLVTGELRRFPELGRAWGVCGPERAATMLAEVLRGFEAQGKLRVPDLDLAVIQLVALTLYPHLTASSYGKRVESGINDQMIRSGVEMFLSYYHREQR